MSVTEKTIRMELKYCEACGALRLRPEGDASVYCPRCQAMLERPAEREGRQA